MILAAIVATYLVLSIWYSVSTPILESYDERFHFAYVLSIALDHGLPVQNVEQPAPWGNEGSQPPLYYLLAAAATFWTDQPGFERQIERNPFTTRHLPVEQNDNRNLYIHRRGEDFPYSGNVLGIHIARWLSALFGAGALMATYTTAQSLFPTQPAIALGAAAFQAFLPSFIYTGATAGNDGLLIFLASSSLWAIVRVARSRAVSVPQSLALGAMIGLATMAKLSALPLLGVAALAIYFAAGGWQHRREFIAKGALVFAVFLVLTGWWFARNGYLYGDLLGTEVMGRIAGLRPSMPALPEIWADVFNAEQSFWAVFGTGNVHPPEAFLFWPRALAVMGVVGCITALVRTRNVWCARRVDVHTLALFLSWGSLYVLAFAWWMLRVEHTNGRLLYPLLMPFASAVVYGIYHLASVRWQNAAVAASSGGMLMLAVLMPIMSIGPAYARPAVMSAATVAQIADPPNVVFGDLFRLLAYSLREPVAQLGKPIHVDLYWQALNQPTNDYVVYVHVLGQADELMGGVDTIPGRGSYPTTDWPAGQIIKDTLSVYLDKQLAEPIAATLVVGWYDLQTKKGLPPRGPDGQRLSRIAVGRVRVPPAASIAYHPTYAASVNFDDQIDLIGYDLSSEAVILYWRARSRADHDYTAFVHVLDSSGKIIVQADAQPRGGNYPTSFWQPGEVIRDEHRLLMPADYSKILVGLYQLQMGARLKLVGHFADAVELR